MGLLSLFRRKPLYEYGTVNGKHARKNRKTGEVQFVMWKAGEQGHMQDYWINFNSYLWPQFEPASSVIKEASKNG
jgi:hypothetical protein